MPPMPQPAPLTLSASFEVAHETLRELAQQPAQAKPRPASAVQKVRARLPTCSRAPNPRDIGAGKAKQPYEAVYVNLAKRMDRRRDMERSLRSIGVAASRFEARTGEETPVQVVQLTWDSTLNANYDTKQRAHPAVRMTAGERGCCMSHA
eukprot:2239311-Prymnesium_polylepis.1